MAGFEHRRGFKTEAEQIASELRHELGLTIYERLDCLLLAAHLCIPVVPLHDLCDDGASAEAIAQLCDPEAKFSAVTVCRGTRGIIVYNPDHPPGRRANSVAHELSHIILEHPLAPAFGPGGCRHWDSRCEAEADWQAGALLVPREGALAYLRRDNDIDNGARHFGVSKALFRWRADQTGVTRQLRSAARFGRYRPD